MSVADRRAFLGVAAVAGVAWWERWPTRRDLFSGPVSFSPAPALNRPQTPWVSANTICETPHGIEQLSAPYALPMVTRSNTGTRRDKGPR